MGRAQPARALQFRDERQASEKRKRTGGRERPSDAAACRGRLQTPETQQLPKARLRELVSPPRGNECDPGQRRRGALQGTGSKGESSPRSPPRRRPAAGPPRPARHRHAPRADPTPLPAPPHGPHRPHQPAGSRGNPASLPPEVGQRQSRTCAPPSARAAGPPRSMRQPPGAVFPGGGGGGRGGSPRGRLRAWSCPAPD